MERKAVYGFTNFNVVRISATAMAAFMLIPMFLHGVCGNGVLTTTEIWVTEERSENRQTAFETCRFNGGRLLDLETPQARIGLKKLHDLKPSPFHLRYFIGLRVLGDNFIWDDECRPASSETVTLVTGELSDYSTIDFKPSCFQLRYRPGMTGYFGLNFLGEWLRCNNQRRFICEIPTTDECEVTAHDHVTMNGEFPERILTLDEEDIRWCSEKCDIETMDGNPCWFYGTKDKLCHLWFAESQPFSSPLQKNRVDGLTIYAKDCVDVILGDLPPAVIPDNHDSCEPESQDDDFTISTTMSFVDLPTTIIAKTYGVAYSTSTNEGVNTTITIPGGTSDKSLTRETTMSLGITNIDSSLTIFPSVPNPSQNDKTVTAPSIMMTEPSAPKIPGCQCACVKKVNQTAEEKQEFTNEILGNLTIDVKKTSANVRKYVSAKDDRPSAQKIGGVGAVMLVIAFGTPVLLDLSKVVVFFVKLGLNNRNHKKGKPVRINVEPFRSESDTTDTYCL